MVRRRAPAKARALAAAEELSRSEAEVALLDRVRPLDFARVAERLAAAYAGGNEPPVTLRYAARAELGRVRRSLEACARDLGSGDPEEQLLAERASELALEAELAEAIGQPTFVGKASLRFPGGTQADGEAARRELAVSNAGISMAAAPSTLHDSADAADPSSVLSIATARLAREGVGARIEICPDLASRAAVASGVLRLRPGLRLSRREGERLVLHEVEGHLLPRACGRRLGGLFSAGSAHSAEDEEGRALLLESRAGYLDAERRRELALRYLAAESVREGADFWETAGLARLFGSSPASAVQLALRVHRGGGLAREIIYFPALFRVSRALSARPGLEAYLAGGRLSVEAAARLADASVELDDDRNVI